MTTELMAFLGGLLFLVVLIATITGDTRPPSGTVILLPQAPTEMPQQGSGLVAVLVLLLVLALLALLAAPR